MSQSPLEPALKASVSHFINLVCISFCRKKEDPGG